MSLRSTPPAGDQVGLSPSRTAVAHTLPATSRPGGRQAAPALPSRHSVIALVPVSIVNDQAQVAVSTALSMSAGRVVAVHVCETLESARTFTRAWEEWEPGVPLVLLDCPPARTNPVATSIANYIGRRHPARQVFVVVSDNHFREAALLQLPNVVVCRTRAALSGRTTTMEGS